MGDDNPRGPAAFALIEAIHALHQQGITTAADIARALNDQGVTTPKGERWHARQVQRFLFTGTTKPQR
jgi:Recombinase